ncbi:hypothetical protein ACQUWY_17655, partial [Ralstonia pseudosolanacearum]
GWGTSYGSLSYDLFVGTPVYKPAALNRMDEAHAEYERAAALARNRQERTLLLERAARCRPDD